MEKIPHVAILPTPGMGHLIPIVEFAKRILSHGFNITLIVPNDGPLSKAQKIFLDDLPHGISHRVLPPVSFDDLPDDVKIETRISLTVSRSLPSIRDAVKSLVATTRLVAFVVDLFGTDGFDVAREFKVAPYIFFPSTAMCLSFIFYLPELDQAVSGEYRDQPDPIKIPGCIPIHPKNLLDPVQDRKNDAYKWVLHHSKRYGLAEGIILNTFPDLEPGPIKFFQEEGEKFGRPPVYPIGPLIQMKTGKHPDSDPSNCLKWLDEQPRGSVLFISFGSGGTLSYNQMTELAFGLEMSEQRFIWVIRFPHDQIANSAYFSVSSREDRPCDILPQGFLDRTKGRGLVVPSWAPQAQILGHESTGGFLTHCGWNSILESVVHGVPLIAWPLYAEQKMNAAMLSDEDLRVTLRPKAGENGVVGRLEIARIVKGLMEGEEGKQVRSRMRDLKDSAAKAYSEEGPSRQSLNHLVKKWKKQDVLED